MSRKILFFFFQAEDGIRDIGVTGVQTCALPIFMEVCDRTEADRKGGHLARRPGAGLVLREIAQTPDEDVGAFQDLGRHRYFNTNNLWVNLPALADVLQARDNVLGLPMIVNRKTVDPGDPD